VYVQSESRQYAITQSKISEKVTGEQMATTLGLQETRELIF